MKLEQKTLTFCSVAKQSTYTVDRNMCSRGAVEKIASSPDDEQGSSKPVAGSILTARHTYF